MEKKDSLKRKFNLDEEILCGYKVTKEMKKVWQVELELLEKFIQVCNKYKIQYFITAGSLLGVVRHGGFIPWDDDIDIGMLRKDYNKLLEVAPLEFKEPYFFQTPYSDKIYRGHAQLRNSNTSAILPSEIDKDFNQGIFIDIFPYDEYPKHKIQFKLQGLRVKFYTKLCCNYLDGGYKSIKSKIFNIFARFIMTIFNYQKVYKKYEKICSKYNGKGNGMISNLSFRYGRIKYMHPKEYFTDLIDAKFEHINVKIPREYDRILSKQYGNYHEFKVGTSTHGKLYLSTEIPYKEYLRKLRKKVNDELLRNKK